MSQRQPHCNETWKRTIRAYTQQLHRNSSWQEAKEHVHMAKGQFWPQQIRDISFKENPHFVLFFFIHHIKVWPKKSSGFGRWNEEATTEAQTLVFGARWAMRAAAALPALFSSMKLIVEFTRSKTRIPKKSSQSGGKPCRWDSNESTVRVKLKWVRGKH